VNSDTLQLLGGAWTPFRHHAIQQALWRSPQRFVAAWAGRGSGKTVLAKRRLVRYLPVRKPWPDAKYFYGAPTRQQAKRIAWDDLLSLIPRDWVKGQPSKSDLCVTTIFGSQLWVVGLDEPQRIEGVQWDGGVIDESSDVWPGTFSKSVLPALAWRKGWCWRIGVPKRQGVGAIEFKQFCLAALKGEMDDAAGFTWRSADVAPLETVQWARDNLDTKDYNEQFGGVWEEAGGTIFHAFNSQYNVRPCPYDPAKPIVVGSDFNVDPMCWTLSHRYVNRFETFDELFIRNTNTQQTLDTLHQRYKDHRGGFEFYGDATAGARKTAASKSDYQQILADQHFLTLRRVVLYPKSNPKRVDRFATCNAMLCNAAGERRAYIDPRCKWLLNDLANRAYKQGTQEPEDGEDMGHMTDAWGYPIYRLFPIVSTEQSGDVYISEGT
jgi:hypothetical protein